jgi:hypothetical protein
MNDNKPLDASDIERKLKELDIIKSKVNKLYDLSTMGEDIRKEVDQYRILQESGVIIPHLDKELGDQLYPKREYRGCQTKPLMQSEIQEALDNSTSAKKAARRLGVSYPTFKKYTRLYGIHKTPGWPIKKKPAGKSEKSPNDPHKGKYPIEEIFKGNHPDFPIYRLKDKLIRSGFKKPVCEQCGYFERRLTDGKLPLLLNFEDGNSKNHNLENLRLLCYNCTFICGKGYISRGPKIFDPDILQDSKKISNQRF